MNKNELRNTLHAMVNVYMDDMDDNVPEKEMNTLSYGALFQTFSTFLKDMTKYDPGQVDEVMIMYDDHVHENGAVCPIYGYKDEKAIQLLGIIIESIHQGFDGWGTYEQEVIVAYLNDLHEGLDTLGPGEMP